MDDILCVEMLHGRYQCCWSSPLEDVSRVMMYGWCSGVPLTPWENTPIFNIKISIYLGYEYQEHFHVKCFGVGLHWLSVNISWGNGLKPLSQYSVIYHRGHRVKIVPRFFWNYQHTCISEQSWQGVISDKKMDDWRQKKIHRWLYFFLTTELLTHCMWYDNASACTDKSY